MRYLLGTNLMLSRRKSMILKPMAALFLTASAIACTPSPETSGDWFAQGLSQVQQGRSEAAIASFEKSIDLGNPDAAVYVNRGLLYDEQGRYAEAIADYTQAIKISPELDEAYYNRGNTHHKLGELEKSVADYRKAIEINKDYVYAYANRAMSYEKAGEVEKALTDLTSALALFETEQDTVNVDRVQQEISRLESIKTKKSE